MRLSLCLALAGLVAVAVAEPFFGGFKDGAIQRLQAMSERGRKMAVATGKAIKAQIDETTEALAQAAGEFDSEKLMEELNTRKAKLMEALPCAGGAEEEEADTGLEPIADVLIETIEDEVTDADDQDEQTLEDALLPSGVKDEPAVKGFLGCVKAKLQAKLTAALNQH